MNLRKYFGFLVKQTFKPKSIATMREESVFSVNYDSLRKKGIKLLIFDVDDTLTGDQENLHDDSKKLLISLKKKFKLAVVTNRTYPSKEIEDFCKKNKISYLMGADKPDHKKTSELLKNLETKPENSVLIGDRPTDIWAAYNAGIKERILVEPYSIIFGTRTSKKINFIRNFEKLFLGKA